VVWLLSGRAPGSHHLGDIVDHAGFRQELADTLGRSLADDPGDRHADAEAWLVSVLAALAPPPVSGPVEPQEHTLSGSTSSASTSPPPTGPNRWWRPLVAGLLVGAAIGGVATGIWATVSGDVLVVSDAGDDRVRVTASDDTSSLSLIGPEQVTVGDSVTMIAEVEGIDSWVWLTPDGRVHPDSRGLEVATSSAGVATIHLVAVGADGGELRVTHDLEVVAPNEP
jgi:eukaryotic-like serine/threonine-protein kinase